MSLTQKLLVETVLRYSSTGRFHPKLLARFAQLWLAEPDRQQAWADADRRAYWHETFMRNQNLSEAEPNEFVARYQDIRRALRKKD